MPTQNVAQDPRSIDTAVSLMRMALALLDRAGEGVAALHLQHAIDVATGQQPLQEGDVIDEELIERLLGRAPSVHDQ